MAFVLLILAGISLLPLASAATTLFNGAEEVIIRDASPECLAAFAQPLLCDEQVQLLAYDLDSLDYTQASLSALCNDSCETSLLALNKTVSSSCGDYEIAFNGGHISAVEMVDLFAYKYNLSCLADPFGDFCILVEQSWGVDALDASGQATWPTYTYKAYPDFSEGDVDGSPAEDVDGILLDLADDPIEWPSWISQLDLEDAGEDFFLEPTSPDWRGHGYDTPLEYDEYPLEIQCSYCFLWQYRHGVESRWGEVYDEVSDQVWNNIKRNCNPDWEIKPANNQSSWHASFVSLKWINTKACDQLISHHQTNEHEHTTVDALALAHSVPSASILHLNPVRLSHVDPGSYCAPLPCEVATIGSEPTSANNFVDTYENITLTQFWAWNTYMNSRNLRPGEVVCVGPPGGSYIPVSMGAKATVEVETVLHTPSLRPTRP